MYKFLNLHPKQKFVSDCVKRAFACATGKPYQDISKELNATKKLIGADKFNSNKNWKRYIEDNGWEKISFMPTKGERRMDGEMFSEKYRSGTYILRMAHHLTCCKDGVIYDTWDCSKKCVYNAWRVK